MPASLLASCCFKDSPRFIRDRGRHRPPIPHAFFLHELQPPYLALFLFIVLPPSLPLALSTYIFRPPSLSLSPFFSISPSSSLRNECLVFVHVLLLCVHMTPLAFSHLLPSPHQPFLSFGVGLPLCLCQVSPTDVEEGMRVGVDRTKYSVQIPLPPKIDPTVRHSHAFFSCFCPYSRSASLAFFLFFFKFGARGLFRMVIFVLWFVESATVS